MATPDRDQFSFDVFLSFRGTDTRTNFTDHLYRALKNAGVKIFRDDDDIRRCENIKSELQIAIKQSKMSVIVFSRDYTSSKACLEEVKTIFQHSKKSKNHDILPVFYRVEPEELKKKARDPAPLQENEEWREALKEVASIAGMPLKDQQYESVFIDEIVQIVQGKLMPRVLPVRDHLVGMKSRVKKIESWLRPDKKGNESVGILVLCGMGGLGKTTTATAVYNSNHGRFEGSSFLSNIREASKTTKDLLSLQRKFLSDIQRKPEKKIDDRQDGHRRIQFVLSNKRILLVLDDVDEEDQLDEIIGMRNWFMPGSKIIITSRREDLLKTHENFVVHRIEKLDDEESLELFSIHAFGKTRPDKGFEEHSKRFVDHCQGLALALEVLGSAFSRMSLKVRNDALTSLGIIPKTKILDKLKISFDSLSNKKDKDLFLDVACFFVGSDKNDTIAILDGCGYYAALGIEDLVHRNLLTVGENNKLGMHQLIQDMGRQVVSDESARLEKRTRLWIHEESFSILRKKIGSANVQGLILDVKMIKKKNASAANIHPRPTQAESQTDQDNEILLETESLKGMYNLRLLKLNHAKLSGSYVDFPQDLRLLCLRGFHMKSLPTGFPLDNIVSLDLRNSSMTQVFWKENMVLETLKILNLSHCHQLAKTPNFLRVPNLEKLILKDCRCLYEIHESIIILERIILLNLKDCKNLRKLPKNLSLVKSLEQLIISGCSNLVGVAEELAKMDSLKGLFADQMAINQILFYVPCEVAPRYLLPCLTKTKPALTAPPETSRVCLPRSLVTLSLIDSNITDDAFPKDFGNLPMLESLNLTGNLISKLPDFIRKLGRLQKLNLSWCRMLEDIEWPEVVVNELIVSECRALQRITCETTGVGPRSITHGACMSLNFVEGGFKIELMENIDASVLENIGFCDFEVNKNVELLIVNGIVWSRKKLPVQVIYDIYIFSTYFHGEEVPSCFTNKSTFSNVLSFIVPTTSSPKIRGLNMCLVYTLPTDNDWLKDPISITLSNKTKGARSFTYKPRYFGVQDSDKQVTWVSHWFWDVWGDIFEEGDEAEVCFNMNVDGNIKGCGINLLYYSEGGIQQYYKALSSSWHSGVDSCRLLEIAFHKHADEIKKIVRFALKKNHEELAARVEDVVTTRVSEAAASAPPPSGIEAGSSATPQEPFVLDLDAQADIPGFGAMRAEPKKRGPKPGRASTSATFEESRRKEAELQAEVDRLRAEQEEAQRRLAEAEQRRLESERRLQAEAEAAGQRISGLEESVAQLTAICQRLLGQAPPPLPSTDS